jgi:hypothetical protein
MHNGIRYKDETVPSMHGLPIPTDTQRMVLTNDSRRMEFGGIHRPEAVMPPSWFPSFITIIAGLL